jgi:hypothetical protein
MAELLIPPRRTLPDVQSVASSLTLNAMCERHGLIQLASTFNQPHALSIQHPICTTEARRDSTVNQCEAET